MGIIQIHDHIHCSRHHTSGGATTSDGIVDVMLTISCCIVAADMMSEVLYDHDSYDMNRWVSSKYMTISTATACNQCFNNRHRYLCLT